MTWPDLTPRWAVRYPSGQTFPFPTLRLALGDVDRHGSTLTCWNGTEWEDAA